MKTKNYFYKTGVDITKAKSMYEFINNHFTYYTLNSWNGLESIANNVKIYNLGLSGDEWQVLDLLRADNYDTINDMIYDWEHQHTGYRVGFNGRSDGYLVLTNKSDNRNIIPNHLYGFDSYDDFKKDYIRYCGTMQEAVQELQFYTKLIRDFDRLCDELREYCDGLSKIDYKKHILEQIEDRFNFEYEDELEELGIESIKIEDYKINVETLTKSLRLALANVVNIFTDYSFSYEENYLVIDF